MSVFSSVSRQPGRYGAFTLLELLVVMTVMVVLFALVIPAMKGLLGANNLNRAAYTIQGALDQARTYAMANNTYTWVGLFEEDNSNPSQAPALAGVGCVVICVVASRDGSCIYSKTQAQADNPSAQALPSSRLVQIGKLTKVSNVHVFNATAQTIGKRRAGVINDQNVVGLTSHPLLFSFQYPLSNNATYTFGVRPVATSGGLSAANGVIQFSPRGEAISDTGPVTIPATTFEIALEESYGSHSGNTVNVAAIDINGLTGQIAIYQP